MLEILNISKAYGKTIALKNVNLLLSKGIHCLVGPNGAGKSTLIKLITTLNRPDSGSILFNGKPIYSNQELYCRQIGYLPQEFTPYGNLTIKEFLMFVGTLKSIPENLILENINEVIDFTNLSDQLGKKCKALSGGMVRRLGIAQAILGNPQLIILDEPGVGLDPEERINLRNMINRLSLNRTVLMTTHIVSQIDAASSQMVFLGRGKVILQGEPERLLSRLKGKTWKTTIDPKEESRFTHDLITSRHHELTHTIIRSIGNKAPYPKAVPTNPNLEDLYLYIQNMEKIHVLN